MGEMRSSRRTEVSLASPAPQLTNHNIVTDLTSTWKSLTQTKAALRHIENRIEASPGTGVCLDSVFDSPKRKSSRTVCCSHEWQDDDVAGSSKTKSRSQQSPEKSNSRSPLRNTTQDSNVRRNNSVEFREPLASYREATPPLHPSSQLDAYSLQSVPRSSTPSSPPLSDPLPSQLGDQRDIGDKQTDKDLDSTHSSALESTEVRYLNDHPALDNLQTGDSIPKAQLDMHGEESSPSVAVTPSSVRHGESSASTSPSSASHRLENLRRHQPDDKLEKLKERIRRQRKHLEEAAEREKMLSCVEKPILAFVGTNHMLTAKVRKVATAPPAPIYKGFNITETKYKTAGGRVGKEDEIHPLSRELYKDLSRQFAETTRIRDQQQREQRADRSKERRPPKPVRKVQRVPPGSDLNAKSVISPASWREGQKLVKMVLGSGPKVPREEDDPHSADRQSRTASRHRSDSSQLTNRRSRQNSSERSNDGSQGQLKSRQTTSVPLPETQNKAPVGVSTDLLSADIQDMLDDLQLECKEVEEERARKRSRGGSSGRRGRGDSGSQTRTPVSTWGPIVVATNSSRCSRSASPTTKRSVTTNTSDRGHKKRHYDADTVRQYIVRQQEERKRRKAEEKRAMREDAEKRNQRLQELYRKQREVAQSDVPVAPVQKQLQATYSKLLLEEARHSEEATQAQHPASSSLLKPMYQPSGESDKENKRLEATQSPSSSDRSLNDQPPPFLSRNDLDVGVASLLQPDRLSPARTGMGPSSSARLTTNDQLLSKILRLEKAVASSSIKHTQRPATAPFIRPQSKMSRIEAIKATAASLSNRIESEARKLAGEGINYGTASSLDTVLAQRTYVLNDDHWVENFSQAAENDDMAFRIQKLLTDASQRSYDDTALPGTGNVHAFREQKERDCTQASLTSPHRAFGNEEKMEKVAQRKQYNEEEDEAVGHDSSATSISEGPLSEGSFSEDEASPPQPPNSRTPRAAKHLEAVDCCASQRKDYPRLFECIAKCSPFAQHDSSKAGWEELNKGSPLSVINIFTRNLHGHGKVSDRNLERNSPVAHSVQSENTPGEPAVYEDDFVSSHSSRASSQLKRGSKSPSMNSHFEELTRRPPYEKSTGGVYSQQSSFHSSTHTPHPSSGSTSGSSPHSRHSARKRGTASDHSDATLIEEQRSSCSPPSESFGSRKKSSNKSSPHSQAKSVHTNDTSEHSHQRSKLTSPSGSTHTGSPPAADSFSERMRSGSQGGNTPIAGTSAHANKAEMRTPGTLQYSPAVLQQRMAAELHYLESIEDSVRHLGDVERLMGVSMAQQESASLAQMLKAKQQRHERDLYELKIKAEREALEAKLQLEENRQKVARAHIELQESLAATQREALEGLQESTTKMMSQQAEAARYTADAARHIKEMTEMARSQVPPIVINSSILDQQGSSPLNQQEDKAHSDSFQSEVSSRRARSEGGPSSLNSLSPSDSLSFKRPDLSEATSGSHHSPTHISSDYSEPVEKEVVKGKWRNDGGARRPEREAASYIEEEVATAAPDSICSDSIPSALEEKGDSTSVATEYSLKFDESMTEDEIEERSFRSLLPSEAHRRGTMEKKSRHHDESEDDGANNNTLVSGSHNMSKDANKAFSGGQDSFSQFTMDMVRQYMKDEEVRLQHQSSLLHLRQKALKEKTRTELAWLEHQKKRLRDKGEDDKMPPIRKKQRGLLMKLQQEQAEIKRLQEANKAARKERQLLLKQQEEIERMRNSTLRLKERLKCAGGEAPSETPVSELPGSEPPSPNVKHPDDVRSPSPSFSISGSETSSIMQKLKKMRSHTDEKHSSSVHYFFSVFTAHHWASLSVCLPNLHPKFQLFIYKQLARFLTKREQQLMQRRHHAEELLQWKQRLDQEEAEVRRMEKEALAVWNQKALRDKNQETSESQKKEISDVDSQPSHGHTSEPRTDSEKEYGSEGDCLPVTPESSIHTEGPAASVPETPLASVQSSPATYTQDFTSASQSPGRQSSTLRGSHSPAASTTDSSNKTKMQLNSISRTPNEACIRLTDPPKATQSETISDQSDIESRIKALKEELRKRKFMASQLRKEQKKRNKERLKAQEASLLKQLQNYNNFIEKTKAELNKEPEASLDTNSQIKESSSFEAKSISLPSPHRSERSKITDSKRSQVGASLEPSALPHQGYSRSTSVTEDFSHGEPLSPTVAEHGSKACLTPAQRTRQSPDCLSRTSSKGNQAESLDENIVSDRKSDVQEELELERSSIDNEHSQPLLELENEDRLDSQQRSLASEHVSSFKDEEILDKDKPKKQRKTSEEDNTAKSINIASFQPHSAALDVKTSPQPSPTPSLGDHPGSIALSSNQKASINDNEASPAADRYHDDFESSVDSSPRENHRSSRAESQISPSHSEVKGSINGSLSRVTTYDSQDEVIEEEIAEELSHHSGTSERSHQSERLLDLDKQTEDSEHDKKCIDSSHSPPVSPLQTPLSPVIDEMPSFTIGDRVLVGGVQPGTLRFKGPTSFANGFWAGVELDKTEGSNNGTYDGVVYFECEESHGIFAPPDKITHLPDKFELYTDTTEDEDSFFDDLSGKGDEKPKRDEDKSQKQRNRKMKNEETRAKDVGHGNNKAVETSLQKGQTQLKTTSHLNSQHHNESNHSFSNGDARDIVLEFEDASHTVLISDLEDLSLKKGNKKITTLERNDFAPCEPATNLRDEFIRDEKNTTLVNTFAETIVSNFVKETVEQLTEIKKAKEQKIKALNQVNGGVFGETAEEEEWITPVDQKDGLPFFLPADKEELSSPELCNRPESPVLGASGQEELAKRLAELELSRELLDELGDDQDWFDEDFGLSSRREQQRLKQEEEEARLSEGRSGLGRSGSSAVGGMVSSSGVETPPRPELPLPTPPKLPEQPAMVVPHSAAEVEKMVHAATQEIWEKCGLGKEGGLNLAQLPDPQPSQEYLGKEAEAQDPEALSIHSYKKAVYDLTWEILQDIYAEDSTTDQPQWVKQRRVKSSTFHRVKTPGDMSKIQEFITAEVLKFYSLAKDPNQKTDWQKMLKFGRKKRDRVDHILVQELHEEEAQWVNYDEDELFVKMQLADSIFDALLKDTANVLTLIYDKRARSDALS